MQKTGQPYVEATGKLKRDNEMTKVVIATHPQGKPEDKWVQEVIEAF